MDEAADGLLNIGDFSRYSGLSVRMLRHYAERGILVPAERDPFTGYRRYAPRSCTKRRVRMLRDSGCGIPAIGELLPLFADPAALRPRLQAHLDDLAAKAQQLDDQRTFAAQLLDAFEACRAAGGARTRLPAMRVLYLRRTVADYPAEELPVGRLPGPVRDTLRRRSGVVRRHRRRHLHFDDEYRDADVEMAIWREFRGASAPVGGFEIVDFPAQRVATVIHRGSFDTIGDATAAAGAWVSTQGRTRTGRSSTSTRTVGPRPGSRPLDHRGERADLGVIAPLTLTRWQTSRSEPSAGRSTSICARGRRS
jgi:DNA-binding transcriptional MerR regulator